ncbi:hypothetical protein EC253486_3813 [Escherichia coli 2534-86]|nr:hypothetical protein EC253486_3813 [Escherichia coli 2534-86]
MLVIVVNCTITSKFNQMIVMLSHYLLNYRLRVQYMPALYS